jgi:hypothetical protein
MAATRFSALFVMALVALWTIPASGFAPDRDAEVFEMPLPDVEVIQRPSDLPMAVDATSLMSSRYGGNWYVHLWNPASNTPDGIYGGPVDLSNSALALDAEAEQVASSFVAANSDILGARAEDLVVERVSRGNGKVSVFFGQRFHDIPVQGGEVHTVLGEESGRLITFGSSFYGDIDVSPVPLVTAVQAEGIALGALPFNPATDEILAVPELLVLPVARTNGGADYHLVWQSTIGTADPYGAWITSVDAHTGQIVSRVNDVHSLYSGDVQSDVDQPNYCAGPEVSSQQNMYVAISGLATQTTDANGNFSVAGTGGNRTITVNFNGTRAQCFDQQHGNSSFSDTIQENVPFTVDWNAVNSDRAERDAFYWVNEAYEYVRGIDPVWSIPKHSLNVNVNSTCNANWSQWRINLFREGGGCANTGIIGGIITHEFGHGVQFTLLGTQGAQGLGEGNGDIIATFMTDDSVVGRGFLLNQCNGAGSRNCLNTLRYPENVVGVEIHDAGRVICGFNWDARELLEARLGAAAGKAHIANLWHFARKLHSTSSNQPQQVLAYFLEDDDDGNLGNGTPNYMELCEAATNHGFSCPVITEGVNITHTPLSDTTSPGPYLVSAEITAFGPHPLNTSSPTLFYATNGGSFSSVSMSNAGGDTYQANIPGQAQTAVAYYITAETTVGTAGFAPPGAPNNNYRFAVGNFSVFFEDDLEQDLGWSVSEVGEDGTWVRVDPNGTQVPFLLFPVNPEDDHTPNPGTQCWVTGNPPPGSPYTVEEVDGITSIVSPILDMTNVNMVRGSVWLWTYFQTSGADYLEVSASNDGGSSWTSLIYIPSQPPPSGLNSWTEYEFEIWPFDLAFTSQMRFKVTAEDVPTESVLDCAMDDFLVNALIPGAEAVEQPAAARPVSYVLHPSTPNPFNPATQISYELPSDSRVKLSIYDVQGREIRVLADGFRTAGSHRVSWDGTDRNGQALASGVYFYRLDAGEFTETHRMTLLK